LQSLFRDNKSIWLLISVAIVLVLEILALSGYQLPDTIAPFGFGAFILAVGYRVLWNGVRALAKLKFSSITLLLVIVVIGPFYLGQYEEAAVVIVLFVFDERLEDRPASPPSTNKFLLQAN